MKTPKTAAVNAEAETLSPDASKATAKTKKPAYTTRPDYSAVISEPKKSEYLSVYMPPKYRKQLDAIAAAIPFNSTLSTSSLIRHCIAAEYERIQGGGSHPHEDR